MTPDLLRAFCESVKTAGAMASASRLAGSIGKDVGELAVDTFRPSAWKTGIQSWLHEAPPAGSLGGRTLHRINQVAFPLMMGGDVAATMAQSTDPKTGRHIGVGERAAVATSHVGSQLAGWRLMMKYPGWGGMFRGMATSLAAQGISDRAARLAGRGVDTLASAAHPAAQAGGAPVASGVA